MVDKWRLAAQQAASQLFAIVSEKIESVGGINAWYRQFEESKSILSQWDLSPKPEIEDPDYDGEDSQNAQEKPQPCELIGWDVESETWI